MSVVAIIPAAGMGVRMGRGTPKQFLSLEGVPIFVLTLRKFAASDAVDEIYLVLRSEDMERARADVERERFSKPVRLVAVIVPGMWQSPNPSTRVAIIGRGEP